MRSSNILFRFCRVFCIRFRVYLFLIVLAVITSIFLAMFRIDYKLFGFTSDYLSWFRTHRNISEILQLDKDTYIIAMPKIYGCGNIAEDVSVTYFVTTMPQNARERNAIRRTWGKKVHCGPIFLTGFVNDPVTMDFLINEAKIYNDIIIENFLDTYANLTIKTGFIMKHFLRLSPNNVYLMKTDDDMFVNPKKIDKLAIDLLNSRDGLLPIVGKFYAPYKPHRDPESKWYVPYWMYGKTYLPSYVSGTGYLIPGVSVKTILKNAMRIPMLPLEDVFFSGLVGYEASGIPLKHNEQFHDDKPFISHYCMYRYLTTAHHLGPEELLYIWTEFSNKNNTCHAIFRIVYNFFHSESSLYDDDSDD